jgi:hypothetical protein
MRTILTQLPNGRYKIHYGNATIDADVSFVMKLLLDQIAESAKEHQGEAISFEFTGSISDRELSNVVYELECVRKSRDALQYAYENKVPTVELREAYDRWCTSAYTLRLKPLYKALGLECDEDREAA